MGGEEGGCFRGWRTVVVAPKKSVPAAWERRPWLLRLCCHQSRPEKLWAAAATPSPLQLQLSAQREVCLSQALVGVPV